MAEEKDAIARAQAAKRGCPFLNTEQAAAYLGLSPRKLQYLRSSCIGPRYRLHSRFVRYHIDDLIFWSRSTSPDAGSDESERIPAGAGAEKRPDSVHEAADAETQKPRRSDDV